MKHWAGDQASKNPDGDNFSLAIETLDGELIGSIVADSWATRHGTFKYGAANFREHWRNGYASEAVKILVRYYFEELNFTPRSISEIKQPLTTTRSAMVVG
ncbi:GNAT family N-acetyltransferase [Paenibacillus chitinolyticus]|uniref:GNAT family N-acetyltransferase n=1 Tax=Paenibacillus chitinolyticus TaxID=79263 RepID=UPI0035DB27F3